MLKTNSLNPLKCAKNQKSHSLSEELHTLTESQREAARKMKISDEEYSRNFLASERGRTALLAEAERLARFLSAQLKHLGSKAVVKSIALSTIETEVRG